jgi:hypothetical protein
MVATCGLKLLFATIPKGMFCIGKSDLESTSIQDLRFLISEKLIIVIRGFKIANLAIKLRNKLNNLT